MNELRLPRSVLIRVLDVHGHPIEQDNILFKIETFARLKNDISLFPFASNEKGIVHITRDDLLAEAQATYDSGLMDYVSIESAYPFIEIFACAGSEIERALHARQNVWRSLLKGEDRRWNSIDDLIALFKSSRNNTFNISEGSLLRPRVRDMWTDASANFEYEVRMTSKS